MFNILTIQYKNFNFELIIFNYNLINKNMLLSKGFYIEPTIKCDMLAQQKYDVKL